MEVSFKENTHQVQKDKEQLGESDGSISADTKLYFTEKGTKYHLDPNCSGMKNPMEGNAETVGEREACKKCF